LGETFLFQSSTHRAGRSTGRSLGGREVGVGLQLVQGWSDGGAACVAVTKSCWCGARDPMQAHNRARRAKPPELDLSLVRAKTSHQRAGRRLASKGRKVAMTDTTAASKGRKEASAVGLRTMCRRGGRSHRARRSYEHRWGTTGWGPWGEPHSPIGMGFGG